MPPFLPRKRRASDDSRPSKRTLLDVIDAEPPNTPTLEQSKAFQVPDDSDSEISLSDVPSSIEGDSNAEGPKQGPNDDGDDDDIDWEDAIPQNTGLSTTPQDLELTLDKREIFNFTDLSAQNGKKGPSKIERQIRLDTHRLHVQCLLFHNAVRNSWISHARVHKILVSQLPPGIEKQVQKWRVASGLETKKALDQGRTGSSTMSEKGVKILKKSRAQRDWGEASSPLEPGQPDLSRGDPILPLLKVLAAYWKKRFTVTAPGLRKSGYKPIAALEADISSWQSSETDPKHAGEWIQDLDDFCKLAEQSKGSRDVGAQLFTALLRGLGLEARLVASLQPLGFGWTKTENYGPPTKEKKEKDKADERGSDAEVADDEDIDVEPSNKQEGKSAVQIGIDRDLPFPIYWTEVASPISHEIIPVETLVLCNPVATAPEHLAAFEPRGAKADKAKQVIAYVIAHSSDGTAKDVTTRYLKRRTWPGKTKGFRLPMEKIAVQARRGPTKYYERDWFRVTMRGYVRPENSRTVVDDIEDGRDLVPNQPEKKAAKEGDTLQSLRSSTQFVLERFLRREEALRPGATPVRKFMSGKGNNAKEENVYRRGDVERCLSAESWHKEGRKVKMGEAPLKLVTIRAVTLLRKREVQEMERETGEKPKQGLYARHQTEWIIPPPIENGVIPKNEYGNMDCFVPSMVPQGAVHIPWRGTMRVCKKLGVDHAEAVIGFEFGNKTAVPVIAGVIVAAENAELVKDAWKEDDARRRERERLKQEKLILSTWRKFLMGLRIAERVREEYGAMEDMETRNPFTNPNRQAAKKSDSPADHDDGGGDDAGDEDLGGGFLLPDHDDGDESLGGGFLVPDHDSGHDGHLVGKRQSFGAEESEDADARSTSKHDQGEAAASTQDLEDDSGVIRSLSSASSVSEEEYTPPTIRRGRRRQ